MIYFLVYTMVAFSEMTRVQYTALLAQVGPRGEGPASEYPGESWKCMV